MNSRTLYIAADQVHFLTGRKGFLLAMLASLALHTSVLVGIWFVKTLDGSTDIQSTGSFVLSGNVLDISTHFSDNAIETAITATIVSDTVNRLHDEGLSNPTTALVTIATADTAKESGRQWSSDDPDDPAFSADSVDLWPNVLSQATSLNQGLSDDFANSTLQAPASGHVGDIAAISAFVEQQSLNGRAQSYSRSTQNDSLEATRYIAAFTQKVRRIGQLNYPQEGASHRIHGDVRLEIAIDATGRLASTKVIRSSNHEAIDAAALRIIELGAPYAPLPPSLRNSNNQLEFVQNWSFRGRSLSTD